jgi:hypothetical protein
VLYLPRPSGRISSIHGVVPASGVRGLSGRWRAYTYDELINRDKLSLDIFWLRDDMLEDSNNLPAPEVLAAKIVADLQAALEQFREISADIGGNKTQGARVRPVLNVCPR